MTDVQIYSMNDTELVKLAAKAAGLEIEFMHETQPIAFLKHDSNWHRTMFNPLFDCGDALRLMAILKIDVEFSDSSVYAGRKEDGKYRMTTGFNPFNATCRAVTVAAADGKHKCIACLDNK